jgi:predicted O-methyltransferase YrrM
VPSISPELAASLRDALSLQRAVETGTYYGDGARRLAGLFDEVVTIELSPELHAEASRRLADLDQVTLRLGHSVDHLAQLAEEQRPTLYFLDGHWSGPGTAGEDDQCPVVRELEQIAAGHPDDAIVIDDARHFAAPPPPICDASQYPTLMELLDQLRTARPQSHITLIEDQIISVPARAKGAVDAHGQRLERERDARLQVEREAREAAARAAEHPSLFDRAAALRTGLGSRLRAYGRRA